MTLHHKYRLYQSLAVALMVGAVFYGGSEVLGQISPIKAGALAAKPNGVPTCLATCPIDHDHEGEPEKMKPAKSTEVEPVPNMPPPAQKTKTNQAIVQQVSNKAKINQQAAAVAQGNHAVAIAKNTAVNQQVTNLTHVTHVTKQVTHVTKQVTNVTQPVTHVQVNKNVTVVQVHKQATAQQTPPASNDNDSQQSSQADVDQAPAQTTPQDDNDQQAAVTQAAVTTAPVQPAPLPATGNESALSTAVGTAAIAGSIYYLWMSRRSLMNSSRSQM